MNNLRIVDERELLGQDFKIYGTKENPLFLAKDVSRWIEHNQPSRIASLGDEEEKVMHNVHTLGGNQDMWFLTEDGLYEVLMQSRKPIAKVFKKEVKKLLKQIRETGGYIPIENSILDREIMAKALMVAQRTIDKNDKILADKEVELRSENKLINQISMSENSLLVREVAKIASKANLTIGEKKLWQKLREWGLICKNSTEPKQTGIDRGYFKVFEGTRNNNGKVFTYATTRVTGKGQAYIIEKLLKEKI